jgi:capsular exopolysaccharide synthesis family protein
MNTSASPFSSPSAIGSAISTAAEGVDFSRYLRLVTFNKWKILSFVLLITGITFILVRSLPYQYEAETSVLIETNRQNVAGIRDVYSGNTQNREYLATQYQILASRVLIEKVVDRLNLTTHPEFDPRQQEESKGIGVLLGKIFPFLAKEEKLLTEEEEEFEIRRLVVTFLRRGITVTPIFGTHMVSIEYTASNPELAASITNAMADVYIESYLEGKLETTQKATSWLSGRLEGLREKLEESESRLQDYKEREQLVDVSGVRTLDSAELAQLREDLVDARQSRIQAESTYQQVRGYRNLSSDQLLAIPTVLNNPVIQSVIEAKSAVDRRVADLKRRYGEKHPRMQAALSEQKEINQDLGARLASVSQGITANYRAAVRAEQELVGQINQTQTRLQSVGRKEVRLRELEREVETNRQLYDLFLSRGKETDESGRIQEPPARIIDAAIPPVIPVGPNKAKYILAAMILSLGVAVGLLVVIDLLDSSIKTSEDVEHKLRASMIGFLPLVKENKSDFAFRAFAAGEEENNTFTESTRSIRTSLILSSLDKPFKIIMVTSSVPGEGKSTIALNVAEALGQMEKVLLIDADMRRPTLAKAVEVDKTLPGLSEIISGTAKIDDCIHKLSGSETEVITSGAIPNNPLELLSGTDFKDIIELLKQRYDRIIIDSAPVNLVSDAQVISTFADSLLYVVKANSTSTSIANKGLKTLRNIDAPITGVILNQVDLKKAGQYDSYYGVYEKNYAYISNTES